MFEQGGEEVASAGEQGGFCAIGGLTDSFAHVFESHGIGHTNPTARRDVEAQADARREGGELGVEGKLRLVERRAVDVVTAAADDAATARIGGEIEGLANVHRVEQGLQLVHDVSAHDGIDLLEKADWDIGQ